MTRIKDTAKILIKATPVAADYVPASDSENSGTTVNLYIDAIRRLPVYTVATLPAGATAGDKAYVTDATAPTYLGALTGGGAVVCPVFYNGSAWVSG